MVRFDTTKCYMYYYTVYIYIYTRFVEREYPQLVSIRQSKKRWHVPHTAQTVVIYLKRTCLFKSQDGLFHVCTSYNEELFYVCIYTVQTTGSEPKPTTSIVVMIPIYGNTNEEHRVPILTDVHDLVRTTGTRIDDHVYSIIDIYQMLW